MEPADGNRLSVILGFDKILSPLQDSLRASADSLPLGNAHRLRLEQLLAEASDLLVGLKFVTSDDMWAKWQKAIDRWRRIGEERVEIMAEVAGMELAAMPELSVVVEGSGLSSDILSRVAPEVSEFGPSLMGLAESMIRTMHCAGGVGLAAPQVGVHAAMFVYQDPDSCEDRALVNPKVFHGGDWVTSSEGCLSLPERQFQVPRHSSVEVEALTPLGDELRFSATGFHAIVIQHEHEHLMGVLLSHYRDSVRHLC